MTEQTQPPAMPPGGSYPQGSYQPQPPPKKKHTLRNVLLLLVLVFVLFIGGCIALVGGAANEVAKEIDKSVAAEAENDKPKPVVEGKAFTHDGFNVASGWTVTKDGLGGVTIEGGKVTNDNEDARSALLTFTFYKGKENLAEVECSSNELQAGESSKLDCVSFDSEFPTGYKTIKVADAF
ncbi:hypothetical protein [Nocardioides houyundeii]|uniref:hypothetical protein n=1 Tax=Nocardioides houyundeii TaxID=2045452 RepID=UPI0013154736|nr:hypothetical protein [Nocardioides houyundeii]